MQNEEGYLSPQGQRLLRIPAGWIPQGTVSHTRANLSSEAAWERQWHEARLEVGAEGAKDFMFQGTVSSPH